MAVAVLKWRSMTIRPSMEGNPVYHPRVDCSMAGALVALRGHPVLWRGKGLPPLSPHPFAARGIHPPLRSGQVSLDEGEHFLHNRDASVATLRWCSVSSRNAVRIPPEYAFSFTGIPTFVTFANATSFLANVFVFRS